MHPRLHKTIALYESIIRELTDIDKIFHEVMEARQYAGNFRFLEYGLEPEFKNNRGPVINLCAQILTGDWHNLDKTIISAYDEALLQIIENDQQANL
jgi:hypothetical protein